MIRRNRYRGTDGKVFTEADAAALLLADAETQMNVRGELLSTVPVYQYPPLAKPPVVVNIEGITDANHIALDEAKVPVPWLSLLGDVRWVNKDLS